jgi:glycine/D-amino acid oxidase-like deaminating enzyme
VTTPYWDEDVPPRRHLRAGLPRTADVAVIGGGVTGCSCALALAERGFAVRLYERHTIGAGASGRNAGFALSGGAMAYDLAVETIGPASARDLWRLSERALDRMAELAGDALRRVGSLRLAVDVDERERLARELDALRADGFEVEWAPPLSSPLAGLYAGAILHPRDGAVHPARWMRRLAEHAAAAGVEVVEGEEADPFAIDAPAVVVATDGLAGTVLPDLADVIRPVRGQVLATAPLARRLFDRPHYARDGFDYWQQLDDGRLVVGGARDASFETEETAADATTDGIQARLEQLATQLSGERLRVTHRWSGIWGSTPDLLPVAGRVPDREGVWVAAGYSGHGNVLGFACGELVARAIAGEEPPELSLFDPARFATAHAGSG